MGLVECDAMLQRHFSIVHTEVFPKKIRHILSLHKFRHVHVHPLKGISPVNGNDAKSGHFFACLNIVIPLVM